MPLFILVVFLMVDLWLGIVGFIAFMPGATGTNRAAFTLWLLLNAPIAFGPCNGLVEETEKVEAASEALMLNL
jgi:hypothetical protein